MSEAGDKVGSVVGAAGDALDHGKVPRALGDEHGDKGERLGVALEREAPAVRLLDVRAVHDAARREQRAHARVAQRVAAERGRVLVHRAVQVQHERAPRAPRRRRRARVAPAVERRRLAALRRVLRRKALPKVRAPVCC